MIGLKIIRNGQEFRIPNFLVLNINANQNKLVVEAGGYFFVYKRLNVGDKFEFEITDFDNPTELISNDFNHSEVDGQLVESMKEEDWDLQQDLIQFKNLEKILKEEGVIS